MNKNHINLIVILFFSILLSSCVALPEWKCTGDNLGDYYSYNEEYIYVQFGDSSMERVKLTPVNEKILGKTFLKGKSSQGKDFFCSLGGELTDSKLVFAKSNQDENDIKRYESSKNKNYIEYQKKANPNFAVDSNGLIGMKMNNPNNLVWMPCDIGQTTEDGVCKGKISEVTWWDALRFARDSNYGGYSDWRLPTLSELSNIYCGNGLINQSRSYLGVWSQTLEQTESTRKLNSELYGLTLNPVKGIVVVCPTHHDVGRKSGVRLVRDNNPKNYQNFKNILRTALSSGNEFLASEEHFALLFERSFASLKGGKYKEVSLKDCDNYLKSINSPGQHIQMYNYTKDKKYLDSAVSVAIKSYKPDFLVYVYEQTNDMALLKQAFNSTLNEPDKMKVEAVLLNAIKDKALIIKSSMKGTGKINASGGSELLASFGLGRKVDNSITSNITYSAKLDTKIYNPSFDYRVTLQFVINAKGVNNGKVPCGLLMLSTCESVNEPAQRNFTKDVEIILSKKNNFSFSNSTEMTWSSISGGAGISGGQIWGGVMVFQATDVNLNVTATKFEAIK